MSGLKPFLIFLDTVSSAEAFIRDAEEYDQLDLRMELVESYLSRMFMVFECIFRLPNVSKAQVERVTKVMTSLINLKTVTWIGIKGNSIQQSTRLDELKRKGIHPTLSEDK